jgi:hypothetical protein
MFKFLRKYNKWILAVGGTLLMIVFLIPQAIEGMAQRAGGERAARATVMGPDGREVRVTWAQWMRFTEQAELLDRLDRQFPVFPAIGRLEGAAHWFLLVHEAELAGLVPSPGSVDIPAGQPSIMRQTQANMEGVGRLIHLYSNAAEVSDHRLQQYAARILHNVETRIVPIIASADQVDIEPTEQDLREQLDLYGHLAPGEGPMGFGYKLPDRVKLEWLSVSAEAVRGAVLASGRLSNVELYRHWYRESRRPESPLPPYESDVPIPNVVREHLLDQLTAQTLDDIEKFANDHLRAARRGLRMHDGYAVLPEDWEQRRPSLTELAQAMQERFEIALPAYRSTGGWIAVADLETLEGIGRASTQRLGATARFLRQIVAAAREFGGSPLLQVQAGLAGPPLRDEDGGVHVYRIIDADPARPPHSVGEAQDALVRDARRLAHYWQLIETLGDIEVRARSEGLLAIALEHDTRVATSEVTLGDLDAIGLRHQLGQPMTAVPRPLPEVGASRDAVVAIIDRAMAMPEGSLEALPVDERIFALPVEEKLAVLVVQLVRNQPVSQSMYAGLASANIVKTMLMNEELAGGDRVREAFSYETLVKRHNFRIFTGPVEEEEIDLADASLGR